MPPSSAILTYLIISFLACLFSTHVSKSFARSSKPPPNHKRSYVPNRQDSDEDGSLKRRSCAHRGSLLLFCKDEEIFEDEEDDVLKRDDSPRFVEEWERPIPRKYSDVLSADDKGCQVTITRNAEVVATNNGSICTMAQTAANDSTANDSSAHRHRESQFKYMWVKVVELEPAFRYHVVTRTNRLYLFDCNCDSEEGLYACYEIPANVREEEAVDYVKKPAGSSIRVEGKRNRRRSMAMSSIYATATSMSPSDTNKTDRDRRDENYYADDYEPGHDYYKDVELEDYSYEADDSNIFSKPKATTPKPSYRTVPVKRLFEIRVDTCQEDNLFTKLSLATLLVVQTLSTGLYFTIMIVRACPTLPNLLKFHQTSD